MSRWARGRALYLTVAGGALIGVAIWALMARGPGLHEAAGGRRAAESAARPPARPNVLLVVYDARRRDDFSFGPFGNRRGDTPFLAELAERSIFFEDAVAPGVWTVPVHASMFTGLSVCELGID